MNFWLENVFITYIVLDAQKLLLLHAIFVRGRESKSNAGILELQVLFNNVLQSTHDSKNLRRCDFLRELFTVDNLDTV